MPNLARNKKCTLTNLNKCKAEYIFGILTYSMPMAELLVMTGILFVLQMVLSGYMSGYLQKEALIERIRH